MIRLLKLGDHLVLGAVLLIVILKLFWNTNEKSNEINGNLRPPQVKIPLRELNEKIECFPPEVWPMHYVFDIKVVLGEPKPNQSQQGS